MRIDIGDINLNYSIEEIKEFLIKNGYRIETHKLEHYTFGDRKTYECQLALSDTSNEIVSDNDYILVFERLFNQRLSKFILAII